MVIDGEGMTVYPGLVDALSTWGMPGPRGGARTREDAGNQLRAASPRASRGPEDRPQTTSWIKAADEIQPDDRRIETARNAGFTTAAVFPTTRNFRRPGLAGRSGGR